MKWTYHENGTNITTQSNTNTKSICKRFHLSWDFHRSAVSFRITCVIHFHDGKMKAESKCQIENSFGQIGSDSCSQFYFKVFTLRSFSVFPISSLCLCLFLSFFFLLSRGCLNHFEMASTFAFVHIIYVDLHCFRSYKHCEHFSHYHQNPQITIIMNIFLLLVDLHMKSQMKVIGQL